MRAPTSPGEIIQSEFLDVLSMTQKQLAEHIGVDIKTVNRIVNGKSSVTPLLALKLASTFATSPQFWLNSQNAVDLFEAKKKAKKLPKKWPVRPSH